MAAHGLWFLSHHRVRRAHPVWTEERSEPLGKQVTREDGMP